MTYHYFELIHISCIKINFYLVRVWSVRFNPHYDQLVLTSSSDSQVVLTRLSSIASEPVKVGEDDDTVVHQ